MLEKEIKRSSGTLVAGAVAPAPAAVCMWCRKCQHPVTRSPKTSSLTFLLPSSLLVVHLYMFSFTGMNLYINSSYKCFLRYESIYILILPSLFRSQTISLLLSSIMRRVLATLIMHRLLPLDSCRVNFSTDMKKIKYITYDE